MHQRFYQSSAKLLSAASLLLLAACSSSGSSFGTGGTDSNNPAGGTGGDGTTGTTSGTSTTGTTGGGDVGNGGGDVTGGAGNSTGTAGSVGPGTGGNDVGAGGNMGAEAGAPPPTPCPKGADQICHAFYANDNGFHKLNYVDEFTGNAADGYVIWSVGVGETSTANSPRTIEIVANPKAKSGKAVLLSLETGYAEFDTTDGAKVAQVTGLTGISGACRLPDGTTALGQGDSPTTKLIVIVNSTGAHVRNITLPAGDNLRAINRNPVDGHFWFSETSLIYEVNDQGGQVWSGNMGAGSKGYAVWWRPGGGAYATTGDPSTVIELDATGKILSTVGGKGATFPFLDFFSGFVRLASGHYVVANWLGHLGNPSPTAPEVVEFDTPPKNEILWKWPDPTKLDAGKYPKQNQSLARQITNVYVVQ